MMKLNYKKTIFVGFAFFLICAFWQAYDSIVPMMLVNKFGLNQTLSGVIMSLDNIIALFMLPLFGALSDKTKSKFGRRTPYVVLGTIVAACSFFCLTFADNAQLAKLNVKDGGEFYSQLFEDNYSITNAEYSAFTNTSAPKELKIKDYAANVVFNKNYDELTDDQKTKVKEWYTGINEEYLKDHAARETVYGYRGGKYFELKVEQNGKTTVYKDGDDNIVDKSYVKNAYTNLVNPALNKYAWKQTTSNPVPLVLFGLLLLLTLIAMATFRSPAVALMPDVTVKPLRSQGNAIINLMGTAGGMLVLVLGIVFKTGKTFNQLMSYTGFIGAVCALMIVGLLAFIWKVREPEWAEEMRQDTVKYGLETAEEEKADEGNRKLTKSEFVSLILILASVALWYIGYNAVTSKYSLYATNVLHKDYNTTLLIAQAAAIISYVPVGFLAQKIGRKKSILIGVGLLAAAFFGATFMNANSSVILLDVLFALAGIGWATINVNSFPMVVELASGGNVGKFTGYYYTASMAAQIVTPILSGAVMDLFGSMRPLFYYATIFVAIAFITMLFVKHGDSKPAPKDTFIENLDVDD